MVNGKEGMYIWREESGYVGRTPRAEETMRLGDEVNLAWHGPLNLREWYGQTCSRELVYQEG